LVIGLLVGCDQGDHTSLHREVAASCSPAEDATGGSCVGGAAGGAAGEGALRDLLPAYYDFLQSLKASGYVFMDFATYWDADKTSLPEKLLVVRHDVHARDIAAAYSMRRIEQALLPEAAATYFVMLGFPPEMHNSGLQQRYVDVVSWLSEQGIDVQRFGGGRNCRRWSASECRSSPSLL